MFGYLLLQYIKLLSLYLKTEFIKGTILAQNINIYIYEKNLLTFARIGAFGLQP